MNSTEQKIRESFNAYINEMFKLYGGDQDMCNAIKRENENGFYMFEHGYLALLNELEFVGENKVEKLYRLPEGIEK
jgi:hypothetical protein